MGAKKTHKDQQLLGTASSWRLESARAVRAVLQDVGPVSFVHLLQDDESEDGVRSQAKVVGRETFPQAEKAFL